ncbi:MAG: TetR/AcrR family transcriptional regulator [Proteobacteria bacterium]|nr:TetR/AcrR family transcriptional regulator [Pseudomonadota bacterium]
MTRKRLAAAKPARRTQGERRRATQEAILQAAIDLLVDDGYARFSTIAVAKRAKVSRGARENYFPSKYDLITAAWRAALIRAQEHARQLADSLDGRSTIERFLSDSESFFLSRVYLALLELQMAARTDKPLAKIYHALYDEYRQSHDDIWIDALVKEGYARARVQAFVRMTHYLLRGMALTAAGHVSRADFRAALRQWRELAPQMLAKNGGGR